MSGYALSHLSDGTLVRSLKRLVAQDCATTAQMLAHVAEVDARKLYLPAAYPSMFAYCVGELRLSEDAAAKRIQAARAARQFPDLFAALADGRIHLTGIGLLAPYLREETAAELLAVATNQTKAEIERLLAERFPRPDVLAWVEPLASPPPAVVTEHALAHVEESPALVQDPPTVGPVSFQHAPAHVGERPRVVPLSSQSFHVQFTLSREGYEKLQYAQSLLGHVVPSGDIARVFERALDALITKLEKAKFGATRKPRLGRRHATANPRLIPTDVRRAVWKRDQGRCTFVSETGRRCEARTPLESDHVLPVARGGQPTVSGLRLRCRAHNQYEAERAFGPEFMRRKRPAAQEKRGTANAKAREGEAAHVGARERDGAVKPAAARTAAADKTATDRAKALEVVPWLRALGFPAGEARRLSSARTFPALRSRSACGMLSHVSP